MKTGYPGGEDSFLAESSVYSSQWSDCCIFSLLYHCLPAENEKVLRSAEDRFAMNQSAMQSLHCRMQSANVASAHSGCEYNWLWEGRKLTLDEIRRHIDTVDSQIRELFIQRMSLAEQVARVKAESEDVIYKPDRESAIIERQSKDMQPELLMEYRALIKRVMEISRKYQYGKTLELRDCFPFSFTSDPVKMDKIAMISPELYICCFGSRDQVTCVDSYQEAADLVEAGKVQAVAGIIERIGRGVSDELNTVLVNRHFYINKCQVVSDGKGKNKVAAFTPVLSVEPDHNRLKLMFVCMNKSGALASILSMIADYGVNLTEIHSIPFRNGEDWNYRFFVELNLNLLEKAAQSLIFQLSCETQELQILGSYSCEGDFV